MYSIAEIGNLIDKSLINWQLPNEPSELYQPVAYMMSIGGKRIRPVLCLLSCNLFTDRLDDSVLFPALGLEIFHGFTLVHDDIMDNSPMRRNQPTVHNKWNTNTAILSGDVMCIAAYKYICQGNPVCQSAILDLFNATAMQVCEGQQYDMTYECHAVISEEEYLQMIFLKTAVLIAAAAKIGAISAGATTADANKMYKFGQELGLAFQIQDDLLDIYGDADIFGKKTGSDILNNKKTYLLVTALRQAKGEEKKHLNELLTLKNIEPNEKVRKVVEIYQHLNIRKQTEKHIAEYFEKALASLDNVEVDPNRKLILQEFAHKLLNRER